MVGSFVQNANDLKMMSAFISKHFKIIMVRRACKVEFII